MVKPLRQLGIVLLGLLAAILIFNGLRITSAGIADFQTRAFLADWESKSALPNPHAWEFAHQVATRAVEHYPVANGAYLERLGFVYAWRDFTLPFAHPDAQLSREAARNAQRAAVEARPTWPYAWLALAHAKLNLLEFDDEFNHALSQALHYGPWRTNIQRGVAEIGFVAWPQLSEEQRNTAIEQAVWAIKLSRRHRAPLFALAVSAGQLDRLCGELLSRGFRPTQQECPS